MLRRVNPIVLLGLTIALILSLGILASAQGGGGTAGEALAAAEGQIGKPFVMATDGPDTFSCVGLMRYALRAAGVDPDAPWSPEAYLGKYAPVDPGNLQPGDIVIYPGWATMYAGNGMLVNANEMEGVVTHTPMDVAGTPLGIVRPPYGGSSQPAVNDKAGAAPVDVAPTDIAPVVNDSLPVDPMATDPIPVDPVPVDPLPIDPVVTDSMPADPMMMMNADPMMMETAPIAAEPVALDPAIADPAVQF